MSGAGTDRLIVPQYHNFIKTSAVTSVIITTDQSAVMLNRPNVHCAQCAVQNTTVEYGTMPWRMIIDQANAAAESNGRFF